MSYIHAVNYWDIISFITSRIFISSKHGSIQVERRRRREEIHSSRLIELIKIM